jgi:hypothetical protein
VQSLLHVGSWHVVNNNIASGRLASGQHSCPKTRARHKQADDLRLTFQFRRSDSRTVHCTRSNHRRHKLCFVCFVFTPRSPFAPAFPTRPPPPPLKLRVAACTLSVSPIRQEPLFSPPQLWIILDTLHQHSHRPASVTGHPLICCSLLRASSTTRRLVPASARALWSLQRRYVNSASSRRTRKLDSARTAAAAFHQHSIYTSHPCSSSRCTPSA